MARTLPLFALGFATLLGLSHAQEATPVDKLVVKEGFKVERLYSVPKGELGSWVVLCKDDKGRLLAGDQYGAIYRFAKPAPGATLAKRDIEKIDLDIGHAWGMCYAFDALYVVVNDKAHGGRGLYRLKDTDGDDKFDKKELLKKFEENGGEHGPHAVVPSPDGKSLYVVCGNQTALPENYDASRVPEVWGEDNLLPRVYGRGFMKGVKAPRGWVCKTDPDGKRWEVIATGFRNQYDIDFNADGEMFTYDADMEWDLNTPWYRPTRINHIISGAEFGWRNGSAKWPDYYSDSFGAVVDIGPGSPTGVTFGTGAKFPAKYQKAFFACDWSYGKLYAVHLEPHGSTYGAEFEEFIAGQPLPLTDITIGDDGAMYFATGGRRVQSGLYRVTYTGGESTAPHKGGDTQNKALEQRRALEKFHRDPGKAKPGGEWSAHKAAEAALPYLGSEDRAMRFAARTVLEHLPIDVWEDLVLPHSTSAHLAAAIASARVGAKKHRDRLLKGLSALDYSKLDRQDRFDLLRAYALVFIRLGEPDNAEKAAVLAQIDKHFPAGNRAENIELSNILTYLDAPNLIPRSVDIIDNAPTQEEQIAIAKNIRHTGPGWSPQLQERYFKWFTRAANYKGGASFTNFINEIKKDAIAKLGAEREKALADIINAKPEKTGPVFTAKPRQFVKAWTMDDMKPLLAVGLEGGRDFENGRQMFGAATCFACHRFDGEGGAIGPDLTSAAGKFGPHDLLESIIEPSKEISDQYGSMTFTMNDGSTIVGRIANLGGDSYKVITDLFAPGEMKNVDARKVKSVDPSPVSMMPPGLLYTLSDEDILDLLAYVLSMGDPENPLFEK